MPKYIAYYSADPLPLDRPLEYYTRATSYVADLVGTFAAADEDTAIWMASESAREQWGVLGAGGYFAAFLLPEDTITSDLSLVASPLLMFKLMVGSEPVWFIAARTILEAVELWCINERSAGIEDEHNAEGISVTMCDNTQLATVMVVDRNGIKRSLGDMVASMDRPSIISCSEW